MAKFFDNANNTAQASPRDILQNKYASARSSLLTMIVFTVINLVLLFVDSSSYFLFSLYMPYILVFMGMLFTGRIQDPALTEEITDFEPLPDVVFTVAILIAVIIIILHLISWIFSKKNRIGWLIFALVLFSIDSALMLLMQGISIDTIIDVVFHAWVIISLANGIRAYYKLQALPPEEVIVETTGKVVAEAAEEAVEEPAAELSE